MASHHFNCENLLRIFTIHQRKGGIHDIYRIFMETFG